MIYKSEMRKLDDQIKVQLKTVPEIQDGLKAEAKRLARKGFKWRYAIGVSPLLNMLVAWYFTLSEGEQERIIEEGKAALENLLNREYKAPPNPASPLGQEVLKVNPRPGNSKKMPNNRHSEQAISQDAAVVLQ